MKGTVCELCDAEAVIYCSSDSAFLCWNCDAKVHEANFLVARHVRCFVCAKCKDLTDNRISGVGFRSLRLICRPCSHESPICELDSLSASSSSSACMSSAKSCATPSKNIDLRRRKNDKVVSSGSLTDLSSEPNLIGKVSSRKTKAKTLPSRPLRNVDSKAEGVLVSWCRALRLDGGICAVAVPAAVKALGVCLNELTVLPLRVSLVASLWFSLRLCDRSVSTWQVLKRLEEISGVPSKLILASELKLARALRRERPRSDQPEEGWAECSV